MEELSLPPETLPLEVEGGGSCGERDAVERSPAPVTRDSLLRDLRALGVRPGMLLLVHSSLSRLGWVTGGPQAALEALLEALGPQGTLVMPTHSAHLTDPSGWQNPPVPVSWWSTIRDHMPAYDPALTPTRGMGAIVECFRHLPGVRRSAHPTGSFAARGPASDQVTAVHALDECFGERSPLRRIYELDGRVLLLGVDHGNNTSLHLAEHRAAWPGKRWVSQSSPILVDGERRWIEYCSLDYDSDDFARIGVEFGGETGLERQAPVGAGVGRLFRQRDAVDYATAWIERNR